MRWDLFCKVVDNFGDVGVGWRLAADLASRGEAVRLCLDERDALAWMAPAGAAGVEVFGWQQAEREPPADVVVEAFGCGLPAGYATRMVRPLPPVWIDLEYLSAEAYVERSHGLPSPRFEGPCAGLTQWFFYPGFTPKTGGLLREPDLLERQRAFDPGGWLRAHGLADAAGLCTERRVSLFCYESPVLDRWLDQLAGEPTLLLVAAGLPAQQVRERLGASLRRRALRAVLLPPLTQLDYDHLLWSCDLNVVRGEDSFVRAQWAGAPFIWQAYRQSDDVHRAKVEAFLDLFLGGAPADLQAPLRGLLRAWNGAAEWPDALPSPARWRAHCLGWRARLATQADLAAQVLRFASEKR